MKSITDQLRSLFNILIPVCIAILIFSLNTSGEKRFSDAIPQLEALRELGSNWKSFQVACWKTELKPSDNLDERKMLSDYLKVRLASALPRSTVRSCSITALGYIARPEIKSLYEWCDFLKSNVTGVLYGPDLSDEGAAYGMLRRDGDAGKLKDIDEQLISGLNLESPTDPDAALVKTGSPISVRVLSAQYPLPTAPGYFFRRGAHSGLENPFPEAHLIPVTPSSTTFEVPLVLQLHQTGSQLVTWTSSSVNVNPRLTAILQDVGNLSVADAIAECHRRGLGSSIRLPLLAMDVHSNLLTQGAPAIVIGLLALLWTHLHFFRMMFSKIKFESESTQWLGFFSPRGCQFVSVSALVLLPISSSFALLVRAIPEIKIVDFSLFLAISALTFFVWRECVLIRHLIRGAQT